MPVYRVAVTETRVYDVTYWVDAENPEQAKKKAEMGEYIRKSTGGILGVEDTCLGDDEPELVKP